MNRRQAKKNFKKKYGINPNQAVKLLDTTINSINMAMPDVLEAVKDIIEKAVETVNKWPDLVCNYLESQKIQSTL